MKAGRMALFLMLLSLGVGLMALFILGCEDDDNGGETADFVFTAPGLEDPVRIYRDDLGIVHIYAKCLNDLYYAQGYMQAHDRFWQMDLYRRVGGGRLTEILGGLPPVIENDIYYRTLFMGADGVSVLDTIYQNMDETTKTYLEAYTDGINFYLDKLGAGEEYTYMPEEYHTFIVNVDNLEKWDPKDTIAIGRLQTWDLSGSIGEELDLTEWLMSLPADVFSMTVLSKPAVPVSIFPSAGATSSNDATPDYAAIKSRLGVFIDQALLRQTKEKIKRIESYKFHNIDKPYSNNWALSPSITDGLGTLCFNDPHLGTQNPPIFHFAHLVCEDAAEPMNVMGVSFPGTPGIVIGHNEHIAWGDTVVGYDVTDIYQETRTTDSEGNDAVLFNGEAVPIIKVPVTLKLGPGEDAPTQEEIIEVVPHHGPILAELSDGDKAYSIRWTGHEPTNEIKAFFELNKATTVLEAFDALKHFGTGAQNFVIADKDGNIGYYPHALVPIRENIDQYPPYFVLPGTGGAEWIGYIPDDRLPQLYNPETGFIATSNNDIYGTTFDNNPLNDEYYWYFSADIGFRAGKIEELINKFIYADTKTMEDLKAIQTDIYDPFAERLAPHFVNAATNYPDLVEQYGIQWAVDYLNNMSYYCYSGYDEQFNQLAEGEQVDASIATSIFFAAANRLGELIYEDEFESYGTSEPGWDYKTKAVLAAIEDTSGAYDRFFDDITTADVETKDMILLKALNQAVQWLSGDDGFGTSDYTTWRWGDLHYWKLEHAFSSFGYKALDYGPFPGHGGDYTVCASRFSTSYSNFKIRSGANCRLAYRVTEGNVEAFDAFPGGNVAIKDEPYRYNLMDDYVNRNYFTHLFYEDDVMARKVLYIKLTP